MNAVSVEMMSVRTRSGKKDAIQKPRIINPTRITTFTNGLLSIE
jgi:hypothetical protein